MENAEPPLWAIDQLLELLATARRTYAQSTRPTPTELAFSQAFDAIKEWRQALKESGDD